MIVTRLNKMNTIQNQNNLHYPMREYQPNHVSSASVQSGVNTNPMMIRPYVQNTNILQVSYDKSKLENNQIPLHQPVMNTSSKYSGNNGNYTTSSTNESNQRKSNTIHPPYHMSYNSSVSNSSKSSVSPNYLATKNQTQHVHEGSSVMTSRGKYPVDETSANRARYYHRYHPYTAPRYSSPSYPNNYQPSEKSAFSNISRTNHHQGVPYSSPYHQAHPTYRGVPPQIPYAGNFAPKTSSPNIIVETPQTNVVNSRLEGESTRKPILHPNYYNTISPSKEFPPVESLPLYPVDLSSTISMYDRYGRIVYYAPIHPSSVDSRLIKPSIKQNTEEKRPSNISDASQSETESTEDKEGESRSKKSKIRNNDLYGKSLTYDELSKFFHMSLTKAASKIGVSVTKMKKMCRKEGIRNWPYKTAKRYIRKMKSKNDTDFSKLFQDEKIKKMIFSEKKPNSEGEEDDEEEDENEELDINEDEGESSQREEQIKVQPVKEGN